MNFFVGKNELYEKIRKNLTKIIKSYIIIVL